MLTVTTLPSATESLSVSWLAKAVNSNCLDKISQGLPSSWDSLVAQLVKNLPAVWETWVLSLGWEDPLEKGKATYSSILGLPLWLSWLRIRLQCKRPGFYPWVGKILWRRIGYLHQYSALESTPGSSLHTEEEAGLP